jgi:hypothetical protein
MRENKYVLILSYLYQAYICVCVCVCVRIYANMHVYNTQMHTRTFLCNSFQSSPVSSCSKAKAFTGIYWSVWSDSFLSLLPLSVSLLSNQPFFPKQLETLQLLEIHIKQVPVRNSLPRHPWVRHPISSDPTSFVSFFSLSLSTTTYIHVFSFPTWVPLSLLPCFILSIKLRIPSDYRQCFTLFYSLLSIL